MPTIEALRRRQRELEAEIAEARMRLPAHSIKPPVMKLLLDLEDEYDEAYLDMECTAIGGTFLAGRLTRGLTVA